MAFANRVKVRKPLGHRAPKAWLAIGPRRQTSRLPRTARDRAMWDAGYAAGYDAGLRQAKKHFREELIALLGLDLVFAPKER